MAVPANTPAELARIRAATPAVYRSQRPVEAFRHARAVNRHAREVAVVTEHELIDTAAAEEVALTHLASALRVLHVGRVMAGDDEAAQYLVARTVSHLAERNNRRLVELFP